MLSRFMRSPYRELESGFGYTFRSKSLLEEALLHRSYRFENSGVTKDNQRLEFLGDAVLCFQTAAYFYDKFTDRDEGFLTSLRSQTTSGKALAELGEKVGLGAFVRLGKGEERSGGRLRPSNMADTFEAVVGAAYLDGGMRAVDRIFKTLFVPLINTLSGDVWADNPKGKLQEITQRKWKLGPRYRIADRTGPAHQALFCVEVLLGERLIGSGKGRSKQEAETEAALNALRHLEDVVLTEPTAAAPSQGALAGEAQPVYSQVAGE